MNLTKILSELEIPEIFTHEGSASIVEIILKIKAFADCEHDGDLDHIYNDIYKLQGKIIYDSNYKYKIEKAEIKNVNKTFKTDGEFNAFISGEITIKII